MILWQFPWVRYSEILLGSIQVDRSSQTSEIKLLFTYLEGKDRNAFQIRATTVMILSFRTPKTFVVITLKFELCGFTID